MKTSTLIKISASLLSRISSSRRTADSVATTFFRKNKFIGSKERRFISETVFASLRLLKLLEYCSDNASKMTGVKYNSSGDKAAMLIISACRLNDKGGPLSVFDPEYLLSKTKTNTRSLTEELSDSTAELLSLTTSASDSLLAELYQTFEFLDRKANRILTSKNKFNTHDLKVLAARYSAPAFFISELFLDNFHNHSKIINILTSLMQPARLTIRVNSLKTNRNDLAEDLSLENIPAIAGKLSPQALIITKRSNLTGTEYFRKGFFEIQDEGSQIISYLTDPGKNKKILDSCAGAGGKTLQMADIQKDKGNIDACDIDNKKIEQLKIRAKRNGFKSINTMLWAQKDSVSKIKKHSFDSVLMDAPCSGSGTYRRNPVQKWLLDENRLMRFSRNQKMLIEKYSAYVKPGGLLVYATCSLLAKENENIIESFMDRHNEFKIVPVQEILEKYDIIIPGSSSMEGFLKLDPAEHDCDGFFAAVLKLNSV